MIVINTVSNERFSLNGVEYFKNFLSFVSGDNVAVYNAYDSRDGRVSAEIYSNFIVNGVTYASALLLQQALIGVIYTRDSLGAVNTVLSGSITPTSTPTGTGKAFWVATQAGTYTNFGSVVVAANSFAVISRDGVGAFSISQTTLDITSKVNVSDVVNTLTSTETAKPLSAAQGKALNEKIAKGIVAWTAIAFASGDQVNHLGKDWTSNAATISTDIPGTSSKWVERLGGYLVKNKVKFIVTSKNLFDKTNFLQGYINYGDGLFIADVDSMVSDFIPVLSSTDYYLSGRSGMGEIAFYDINKALLPAPIPNYSGAANRLYTTTSSTAFVRFTVLINGNGTPNSVQFEKGNVATSYVPYEEQSLSKYIETSLGNKTIDVYVAEKGFATATKIEVVGNNLFNKATVISGQYVDYTTWNIGIVANWATSNYIKVDPNTIYTINGRVSITEKAVQYCDINKVKLAGTPGILINTSTATFTTPANCYYIIMTVKNSTDAANYDSIMLNKGGTILPYEAYSSAEYIEKVNGLPLLQNESTAITKTYIDKNTVLMGDSITEMLAPRSWVSNMLTKLEFKSINNIARSGARWAHTSSTVYNISNDGNINGNNIWNQFNILKNKISLGLIPIPEVIIIVCGVNDSSVATGNVDTTFTGSIINNNPNTILTIADGVRFSCENIMAEFPFCQIILVTPLYAGTDVRVPLTANTIESCAAKLSIDCIRQDKRAGVYGYNESLQNRFTYDGMHLSNLGALRVGLFLANEFKKLIIQ